MMEQALLAAQALWPSIITAAVILLAAWWPWRRAGGGQVWGGHWGGALAFGAAFAVGFIRINGTGALMLRERWHWLLPMAGAAAALGLLASAWPRANAVRLISGAALALAAGILLHPPLGLEPRALIQNPMIWKAVFAGLVLMQWCAMEPLAARHAGATIPLACWILFTGLSLVLLHSEQPHPSLLAAAMAAASGVAVVIAWLNPRLTLAAGAVHVIAMTLAGLIVIGWMYNGFSDVPLASYALLAAAPPALWLGEFSAVGKLKVWKAVIVRVALVAIPVAIAVGLALNAAGEELAEL